jgi:hypothetical protein
MADEFAALLRAEIEAALGRPPWERLELREVRAAEHAPGEWPSAVVLLRDPHRPKVRFGHRASAELPGGDPADAAWLPTAASMAALELLEAVLGVLRAPSSAADADGVIWF